jgi:hypothetical protein
MLTCILWFIYVTSAFSVCIFVIEDIDSISDFMIMILPILNTLVLIKWLCKENRFKNVIKEIKEKIDNL